MVKVSWKNFKRYREPEQLRVDLGETWFIVLGNGTTVHQVTFTSVRKQITLLKFRSNNGKCKWVLDSEVQLLEKV